MLNKNDPTLQSHELTAHPNTAYRQMCHVSDSHIASTSMSNPHKPCWTVGAAIVEQYRRDFHLPRPSCGHWCGGWSSPLLAWIAFSVASTCVGLTRNEWRKKIVCCLFPCKVHCRCRCHRSDSRWEQDITIAMSINSMNMNKADLACCCCRFLITD